MANLIESVPVGSALFRAFAKGALRIMGVDYSNISNDFKLRRFLRGLNQPLQARHAAYLGAATPEMAYDLTGVQIAYKDALPSTMLDDVGHIRKLALFYLRTYLSEDVLVKVDRATMATSLEARAPFLDKSVIEFAFSLPDNIIFSVFRTKPFLRDALKGRIHIPKVIERPKKGFGLPVGPWFRGPLFGYLVRSLSRQNLRRWGLVNADVVERLIIEHVSKYADHRMILFSLLVLHQWLDANLG